MNIKNKNENLFMNITGNNFLKYCLLFVFTICFIGCKGFTKRPDVKSKGELQFDAANKELVHAFEWAKNKALSYAHDNTDPVGYWYEAALPNREAFCMRDVSHQAIGAELLGLGKHNYNMFLKFAQNISEEKDYCTYWEINRYNEPAPVDYENDADFWYNLPSNFDLTFSAYRLYNWTGNKDYIENQDLRNFYTLSLNEYINHWDLSSEEIVHRNRSMHLKEDLSSSRFGNKRGIPTYNEGGRGETLIGIDLTASIIAAFKSYSEMLRIEGNILESNKYLEQSIREQEFMDEFWWDNEKNEYRSILYDDGTFDYFMVGKNQAFLHYLFYFEAISDHKKISSIVNDYKANFRQLIVELKSYLPIIFYENNHSKLANDLIIDLCSIDNQRRDYPENSFTVIEHLTRGLMGVDVDASSNTFSTIPRLENNEDWAEMKNIALLSNKIAVRHFGKSKTIVTNESGETINWSAHLPGSYGYLYVNGHKTACTSKEKNGRPYSYTIVTLNEGDEATVSTNP
ncbi:MAG: hypothetical protein KJN85_02100 [Maribacter sp.]|nr:hypothetical protein [Maribacter sp.]